MGIKFHPVTMLLSFCFCLCGKVLLNLNLNLNLIDDSDEHDPYSRARVSFFALLAF